MRRILLKFEDWYYKIFPLNQTFPEKVLIRQKALKNLVERVKQ